MSYLSEGSRTAWCEESCHIIMQFILLMIGLVVAAQRVQSKSGKENLNLCPNFVNSAFKVRFFLAQWSISEKKAWRIIEPEALGSFFKHSLLQFHYSWARSSLRKGENHRSTEASLCHSNSTRAEQNSRHIHEWKPGGLWLWDSWPPIQVRNVISI